MKKCNYSDQLKAIVWLLGWKIIEKIGRYFGLLNNKYSQIYIEMRNSSWFHKIHFSQKGWIIHSLFTGIGCNVHAAMFHNFRIAVAVAASSRTSLTSPACAVKSCDYDDSIINGSEMSHYVGGWAASDSLEIDEGPRPAKITRTPSHKNHLSPRASRSFLSVRDFFIRKFPTRSFLNVSH